MPSIAVDALIKAAKGSMMRAKMIGERGQPLSVPLEMLIGFAMTPETETWPVGVECRDIIADVIQPEKPNFVKTALRNCQWNLSKALSASSNRSTVGLWVILDVLRRWITLLVASGTWRPFTKPT